MAYADKPDAAKDDGAADSDRYIEAIDRYERGSQEWRERSEKIIKIYLDQHRTENSPRRFALLWSNIETLKPAVYARLPVAVVSRRFKDADKVGRKAGEVLERCINTTFDIHGMNDVMECVRDDRLLTSRGQAWVRYEADFEPSETADLPSAGATGQVSEPEAIPDAKPKAEKVKSERACVEYVHWADFGHSLNRTWPEVTIVWRRVYMTKAKVTKRWDEKKADKLNYVVRPEYAQRGGAPIKDACEPQAVIYEIWDKEERETCWIAKEEKLVLESGPPPLNFRDFFPCPRPTYGSKASGSLIPTPDYRYYQDQAEEIDDLTQKIADLTSWLRLRGLIPGGPSSEGTDAIAELMKLEGNQVFVKVESWAGFAEKGGAKGLVEWLPLDMVMAALKGAIEARRELKNDAFEITGISDILRGESDPAETLGAQELKAQTGSRRISTMQRDLARFARDLAELIGEVIAEVFQPQTMSAMSGFDLTTEPPPDLLMQAKALIAKVQPPQMPGMAPQQAPDPQAQQQLQQIQSQLAEIKLNNDVIALLRDERTRGYRIEIETDSTIEPDEQAEKQRRSEFLESVGGFLQQATPVLQMMPKAAPMVGEMLMFMVRGFRAGRQLEDIIEQTVQELTQQAQLPPPPNPEQAKVEAELKMKDQQHQQKMQSDQQQHAEKMQQADQQHAQEMEQSAQQHQQKMQEEDKRHAQELEAKQVEATNQRQADRENNDAQRSLVRDEGGAGRDIEREKIKADKEKTEKTLKAQSEEGDKSRDADIEKAGLPKRAELDKTIASITKTLETILKEAQHVKDELSAPVEIVRDGSGRASGVRRGSRNMKINRGSDGKATGLQ